MIRNNRGFTFIEVLITSVIGILTATVIASYISYLADIHHKLKLRRVSANAVHSLAESIRYNLSLFQVNFDNTLGKAESLLDPAQLPLGIAGNNVVQRTSCITNKDGCQAYMGYVITPSEFVRNLYEVKFLVVSPDKEAKWKTAFTYFITVK